MPRFLQIGETCPNPIKNINVLKDETVPITTLQQFWILQNYIYYF